MDRDKDIGLICDLYSNKDEAQIINKNEIINTNDNKISDIENSITASLLNNNTNKECSIMLCFKFTSVCVGLGLIVIGIYCIINILNTK